MDNEAQIALLAAEMKANHAETAAKLDGIKELVAEKLIHQDKKIDGLEDEIDGIEIRVTSLEHKTSKLEGVKATVLVILGAVGTFLFTLICGILHLK